MPETSIVGPAAVFGDHISGDMILPARFAFLDPAAMADHVLEGVDPSANARVRACPVVIAGKAFGYGTGRESCARALRAAGVRALVGGPFARMFFRNAINNGLMVIDCPALPGDAPVDNEEIVVDIDASEIRYAGRAYGFPPLPEIVRRIVMAGGLIEYGREMLAEGKAGAGR